MVVVMQQQCRDQSGKFKPVASPKGDAIALRLPTALDAQVRAAAGWQQPTKEDNAALREWVEEAIREKAEGRGQRAEGKDSSPAYTPEQMRTAINRVAMTVQPRDRGKALKLLNAVMGELTRE